MRTKISLRFLTIASITTTLIATPGSLAEPAPVDSSMVQQQESVTLRLGKTGRNQTWVGNVGDSIAVSWDSRRGQELISGVLKGATRSKSKKVLAITIAKAGGDYETIFVSQIIKIESSANTTDDLSPDTTSPNVQQNTSSEILTTSLSPEPATKHMLGYHTTPGPGLEDKWPKVFLLPFEGTVGSYARHNEIKQIGEIADQYGDGQIIVLLVDSPGGLVREGDEIHATMLELQKRHTLVAWIRKAISAAAYTSFHCPQVVFMPSGALGSITMFGGDKAAEGAELVAWVKEVGDAAESGDHSREMAEAMVTNTEICSYDPGDGNKGPVIYGTLEGDITLSTAEENLTINATDAKACGFSIGTADTVEELAQVLGLPRWYETTDDGRKIHKNWFRTLERAQKELPDLFVRAMGQRGASGDQIKSLTRQLSSLRKLMKWHKNLGENTMIMFSQDAGIQFVPLQYLEVREKEMEEELARLRAQQRN